MVCCQCLKNPAANEDQLRIPYLLSSLCKHKTTNCYVWSTQYNVTIYFLRFEIVDVCEPSSRRNGRILFKFGRDDGSTAPTRITCIGRGVMR